MTENILAEVVHTLTHNNLNHQRGKMSDNKNLGQKVTDEFHRFAENSPDFKKEIEDMMNSVGEETDSLMKRAKDKIVEFYQESKKHSKLVLLGFVFGISVIILSYGVMKMIC